MPLSKSGSDKYLNGNKDHSCPFYMKNTEAIEITKNYLYDTSYKIAHMIFFPSFVRRLLNLWQLGPWQVDNSTSSSRS